MKKTLLVISSLIGAVTVYGQGTILWEDGQTGGTIAIISPSTATPTVEQKGQTSWDSPSGTTTYTGGWVGNTSSSAVGNGVGATPAFYQTAGNFTVGLYLDTSLSALTADIATGTPVATSLVQTGVGSSSGNAGLWSTTAGLTATDSAIAPSTHVYVGIAAWYSGGGAGSYSAAVTALDPAGYVESTSTTALGGGGPPAAPAGTIAGTGLTSFSLATTASPEPSTIALGVLGASAFLMRLRRKQ